jgi:hypothetical protein
MRAQCADELLRAWPQVVEFLEVCAKMQREKEPARVAVVDRLRHVITQLWPRTSGRRV